MARYQVMNPQRDSNFYFKKAIEYCEKNNIKYKNVNGILIIEQNKEQFERELWEYILNDTRAKVR